MSVKSCADVLKKKRSREAARQRRGQQNDEFSGLSGQLAPLLPGITNQLDRLCVMKLTNSFIKMKHLSQSIMEHHEDTEMKENHAFSEIESNLVNALGGFVIVIAEDGHCLYVSPNVMQFLGLSQLEMIGDTVYKYVHPCDQPELAKQLGGQVPLEDMEIFDGLFSNDESYIPPAKKAMKESGASPYRSLFMRMKSTITSRGKSVNLNASIYRVVQCIGTLFPCTNAFKDKTRSNCMLAIATPLLSQASFEVPLDRQTFTSKHSLDMKVIDCDESIKKLLGFSHDDMMGKSWYNIGHACDVDVVKSCHSEIIEKGQAVSGYYRLMNKTGGWIWLQTIGSMVYSPTNCRPLYILCINYVISGVEGDSNIVSIEQTIPSIKRQATNDDCPISSKLVCNDTYEDITPPPCSSASEEVSAQIAHDLEYQDALIEFYDKQPLPIVSSLFDNENDDDDDFDDDLPSLEFLDGDEFVPLDGHKDDFIDNEEFLMRAPFIPPPPVDEMLMDFPLDDEFLNEMTDENSINDSILAARAPFIPPPCIDSFLTLDDFDDYEISPSTSNGISSTENGKEIYIKPKMAFKLSNNQSDNVRPYDPDVMIRMVNVGDAAVPSSLIRPNLKRQSDTSVNDLENQSLDKANGYDRGGTTISKAINKPVINGKNKLGKGNGINRLLPLITNDDVEINCPSFDLLHGGDLFSALDQLYCPPAR